MLWVSAVVVVVLGDKPQVISGTGMVVPGEASVARSCPGQFHKLRKPKRKTVLTHNECTSSRSSIDSTVKLMFNGVLFSFDWDFNGGGGRFFK